ncbi:MAG: hypothetical protein J5J00_13350 [Deltaproteobacteria bacterium]|nr:hypothetical protein [Deltaproteobacteria bacterium]
MFGEYPVTKIINQLGRTNLLPAILFRTSRRQCDVDVERLYTSRGGKISENEQNRMKLEVDSIIEKYKFPVEVVYEHPHYHTLIATAAGAHHAGQLLIWRLILEELMTRGQLRLLIATGTVAAGVDFPARTVVITAHSRRGAEGFEVLSSSELQQMAGRAGRRGKDTVGICLVAPSLFADARIINEVAKRPPEPLRSAYFASPSTVLNLLKFRNVDDLRYTVSRSLASFLDRKASHGIMEEAQHHENELLASRLPEQSRKKAEKKVRRLQREAEALAERQGVQLETTLERLRTLGFVEGSGLSEKGYWAADLCTTLVLELAEAIQDGVFHDLGVAELAGLVASVAGDPHRPYFSIAQNPIKKEYFSRLQESVDRVRAAYGGATPYDVAVLPDAALTVLTWIDAGSWNEFAGMLRLSGVAEGDVARLVSQTADHLNQIARLFKSHPVLAETAIEARKKILKPPLSESLIVQVAD